MGSALKAVEAVLGTVEPGAMRSTRGVWLLYFCAPTEPLFFNGLPRAASSLELRDALVRAAVGLSVLRFLAGYAAAISYQSVPPHPIAEFVITGTTWCCGIQVALAIAQAVVVSITWQKSAHTCYLRVAVPVGS